MRHDIERDEWLRGKIDQDLKAMVEKQERQLMESAQELQDVDIPMERLEDIYRRIEEEERILRKNRISRRMIFALAATVVLCIGAGAIGVGSRVYEPEIFQRGQEDEPTTKVNNTEVVPSEYDEEAVCQEIEEKLGVIPVRLSYQPVGMSLSEYRIEEKANEAIVKYELNGKWLYVYITKDYKESSVNRKVDGEKLDTLIMQPCNLEVSVFQYQDSEAETYFETSFKYLNTYYLISGKMDLEDFEKIIENITIKNI